METRPETTRHVLGSVAYGVFAEFKETLPLRHKGVRSAVDSVPQEGEVVLIKEQDTPRGTWIMGRIEETIVGEDGMFVL